METNSNTIATPSWTNRDFAECNLYSLHRSRLWYYNYCVSLWPQIFSWTVVNIYPASNKHDYLFDEDTFANRAILVTIDWDTSGRGCTNSSCYGTYPERLRCTPNEAPTIFPSGDRTIVEACQPACFAIRRTRQLLRKMPANVSMTDQTENPDGSGGIITTNPRCPSCEYLPANVAYGTRRRLFGNSSYRLELYDIRENVAKELQHDYFGRSAVPLNARGEIQLDVDMSHVKWDPKYGNCVLAPEQIFRMAVEPRWRDPGSVCKLTNFEVGDDVEWGFRVHEGDNTHLPNYGFEAKRSSSYCRAFNKYLDPDTGKCYTPWWETALSYTLVGEGLFHTIHTIAHPDPFCVKRWKVESGDREQADIRYTPQTNYSVWRRDINPKFVLPPPNVTLSDLGIDVRKTGNRLYWNNVEGIISHFALFQNVEQFRDVDDNSRGNTDNAMIRRTRRHDTHFDDAAENNGNTTTDSLVSSSFSSLPFAVSSKIDYRSYRTLECLDDIIDAEWKNYEDRRGEDEREEEERENEIENVNTASNDDNNDPEEYTMKSIREYCELMNEKSLRISRNHANSDNYEYRDTDNTILADENYDKWHRSSYDDVSLNARIRELWYNVVRPYVERHVINWRQRGNRHRPRHRRCRLRHSRFPGVASEQFPKKSRRYRRDTNNDNHENLRNDSNNNNHSNRGNDSNSGNNSDNETKYYHTWTGMPTLSVPGDSSISYELETDEYVSQQFVASKYGAAVSSSDNGGGGGSGSGGGDSGNGDGKSDNSGDQLSEEQIARNIQREISEQEILAILRDLSISLTYDFVIVRVIKKIATYVHRQTLQAISRYGEGFITRGLLQAGIRISTGRMIGHVVNRLAVRTMVALGQAASGIGLIVDAIGLFSFVFDIAEMAGWDPGHFGNESDVQFYIDMQRQFADAMDRLNRGPIGAFELMTQMHAVNTRRVDNFDVAQETAANVQPDNASINKESAVDRILHIDERLDLPKWFNRRFERCFGDKLDNEHMRIDNSLASWNVYVALDYLGSRTTNSLGQRVYENQQDRVTLDDNRIVALSNALEYQRLLDVRSEVGLDSQTFNRRIRASTKGNTIALTVSVALISLVAAATFVTNSLIANNNRSVGANSSKNDTYKTGGSILLSISIPILLGLTVIAILYASLAIVPLNTRNPTLSSLTTRTSTTTTPPMTNASGNNNIENDNDDSAVRAKNEKEEKEIAMNSTTTNSGYANSSNAPNENARLWMLSTYSEKLRTLVSA